MQTVLITGGTGLVGNALSTFLLQKGYKVIILSRNAKISSHPLLQYCIWDIAKQQIDEAAIKQADYIVHLAGAGVMEKKWTTAYKKEIISSRVDSSKLLIHSLQTIENNVQAVVSASAIGWYSTSSAASDKFVETDKADNSFLANVCTQWEESIKPVTTLQKRLCILRIGIVLSKHGGALTEFIKTFPFRIAAYMGNGKQIVSWIHIDDLCSMILFTLENKQVHGVYNAVAPMPISNKNLIVALAKKMIKEFYLLLPVPSFILKLILGKRSIEILKSTNVSSKKIQQEGFVFKYNSIEDL